MVATSAFGFGLYAIVANARHASEVEYLEKRREYYAIFEELAEFANDAHVSYSLGGGPLGEKSLLMHQRGIWCGGRRVLHLRRGLGWLGNTHGESSSPLLLRFNGLMRIGSTGTSGGYWRFRHTLGEAGSEADPRVMHFVREFLGWHDSYESHQLRSGKGEEGDVPRTAEAGVLMKRAKTYADALAALTIRERRLSLVHAFSSFLALLTGALAIVALFVPP